MKYLLLFLIITLSSFSVKNGVTQDIPVKNLEFIKYVESHGRTIAPSYAKTNCVQFMDQILMGYTHIDDITSKRIYINQEMSFIKKLLEHNDSTIVAGVCWALLASGKAFFVDPNGVGEKGVKKGDIIQYWQTDGFINGHCGIIYDETPEGYVLLSSHPDSHGYGKMNMYNKKMSGFKIFIVRLK